MPVIANYEWHGEEAKQRIRDLLIGWLKRSTRIISESAKSRVPVDTGLLRSSIGNYIDIETLIGYAGIMQAPSTTGELAKFGGKMADYALWIERGTPRHFAPYHTLGGAETPLARWARGHGFSVPDRGGGLLVWGYKIPFMSFSKDAAMPKIRAEFEKLRGKL